MVTIPSWGARSLASSKVLATLATLGALAKVSWVCGWEQIEKYSAPDHGVLGHLLLRSFFHKQKIVT